MAYSLPDLPYAFDALEPHFDAQTMEIHHDKHHAAYVTKLNAALDGAGVAEQPIEDLCRNPRRDFHMQYTVTLPTRIYAEQYEIRLIITDQQSHKIGQASVAFEIVD